MNADLIPWLRAQLDEDEQVANWAMRGPWQLHRIPGDDAWQINGTSGTRSVARIPNSGQNEGTVRHIARHDPARVLAEVDAKRRIVDLHPYAGLRSAPESCGLCASHPGPCDTLRMLALPYADRPGYRPEWAPAT